MLVSNLLLSAVPIPLINLLEAYIQAVGQVLHILGGPVGVLLEARLEELLLLVGEPMARQSSFLVYLGFVLWA